MAVHNASQPEPVMTRAGIVTAIAVLSALLIHVGLPQIADYLTNLADPIAGVLLAGSTLYSAFLARRHVTPVASPQDNAGAKLAPAVPTVPEVVESPDPDSFVLGDPVELPAT